MNEKYGLTKKDLEQVQSKISNQRDYLVKNHIVSPSGQVKSLMDLSFSANHSVRYYAQLSNKINTMTDYAQMLGHIPLFLTMTLDGFFRDFLKGDYRRYDSLTDEKKIKIRKSIPRSEILGEVLQKIDNRETLTIKDLYNVLNHQTKKMFESYAFKKLRKEGVKYSYIRTAEPHKDGVPHFHMMLYIPAHHKESVKSAFVSAFPAPQNSKKRKDIDNQGRVIKTYEDGQLNGFHWDIKNASAYILKYITKSFLDVKSKKDIDYIQAWYIKHRIMRSVTSHSIVPQWVYQKAIPLEKDWFHLTDLLNDIRNEVEWSKKDDYFCFIDHISSRELIYDRGLYKIMYGDTVIKEFGVKKELHEKQTISYEETPNKWKPKEKPNFIPVDIDGQQYYYRDLELHRKKTPVPYMSDYELYEHFQQIDNDIDVIDLNHYGYVKNELIERDLIDGEIQNINDYQNYEDWSY